MSVRYLVGDNPMMSAEEKPVISKAMKSGITLQTTSWRDCERKISQVLIMELTK